MLGFAVALAIPFALFAMFPTLLKSAPKSGGWMNVLKVVLGFIELAFALKFLSVADLAYGWHILDRETFLALWIAIFSLLGLYLLGIFNFPHDDENRRTNVPQFFLALGSLAFAFYMIPGLWGAPLKAVSAFSPPLQTQEFNLYKNEIHAKFDDYDRLLQLPIYSLTKDRIAELEVRLQNEQNKLVALNADTADNMYERELKELKV